MQGKVKYIKNFKIKSKALCLLILCFMFFQPSMLVMDSNNYAQAALFGEFSVLDEAQLGEEFNVLIRAYFPLVDDPEVISYLQNMVDALSSKMPPQSFPFTVSFIRHNAVNAFAVPGGYIFIHTGLITAMSSEAEVAAVLAHEMAHVSQRHIARSIESSQISNLLSMVGMLAGMFVGGDAGMGAMMGSLAASQAAMLKYSRDHETEADQVGLRYLIAGGYPPISMVKAFKVLEQPEWISGMKIPSYYSTHPAISERISMISGRISQFSKEVQNLKFNNDNFLRIQALTRGRYGDIVPSAIFFDQQAKGEQKCYAYLGSAILLDRQHKVNEARDRFEEALACVPTDSLFFREAGRFHYLKIKSNSKAEQYLTTALKLNKHDFLAQFYYARLLSDAGKLNEAIKIYRNVLRYIPENSEVHTFFANALGQNNQLFLAHLHLAYAALYDNNKNRIEYFYALAKKHYDAKLDEKALNSFEKIYNKRKKYW